MYIYLPHTWVRQAVHAQQSKQSHSHTHIPARSSPFLFNSHVRCERALFAPTLVFTLFFLALWDDNLVIETYSDNAHAVGRTRYGVNDCWHSIHHRHHYQTPVDISLFPGISPLKILFIQLCHAVTPLKTTEKWWSKDEWAWLHVDKKTSLNLRVCPSIICVVEAT